jgi:hypothetical protein
MVKCDRCGKDFEGEFWEQYGMTSGYYLAEAWQAFCNEGETIVCDECMWKDERYRKVYGLHEI